MNSFVIIGVLASLRRNELLAEASRRRLALAYRDDRRSARSRRDNRN